MKPRRTIEIRTPVRALLIASGLSAGLTLSTPAPAAPSDETLLQPTPLILKDGRIANVSVHVLAFPPGESMLGADNGQRLVNLSAQLATDCFLTAQVIGHVGSSEVGNDTLSAHRLARARADAVQASLIADGLPAKSIASVWDWQFMVRAPRATLWVFRLTPGEDCEGTPLESSAPALVAEAEPPSAATAVGAARPVTPQSSEARPERTASAAQDDAQPKPPDRPSVPGVVRAAEAASAPVALPAAASRPTEVPSVTQALPAVSPNPANAVASRSEATTAAGVPEERPTAVANGTPLARQVPEVVAALPERLAEPAAKPAPAAAGQDELVITFPTNSSYFPPGTGARLRTLLRELGEDRGYRVVVQASVSGSLKVVGAESPEEAAKYNQWLAERRVERVQSWLDHNVKDSPLEVRPEYRADDDSRQVVVRLVPSG
jgi:outer membrane protein OmpA-like peptidoglycan-associated protein